MSHPSRQITCEETQRMALRVLLPMYFGGCVVVVSVCCMFPSLELIVLCLAFLLITAPLTHIAADLLGVVAYEIFHQTTLPIPVFIRASAVLLILTVFIWLLTFLDCFHWNP